MQSRIIALNGIHNFRDYGGYPAKDGARIKAGVLYRSSQHRDATSDDLQMVDALTLSHIIDLRGDSEREKHPCRRGVNFAATVSFAPGETAGMGNGEAARPPVQTASQASEAMAALYRAMPFRERLIEIFSHYFDVLATQDGASLIHCYAGKDRTGLAVALLHDALGVHPDDIMADYLLTNVAGNVEARIAAGANVVRADFGPEMEEDAVRTLMSVDAAYLRAGIAAIKDTYGSLAAYRAQVLGVSPAKQKALEERLLI
jgi:protein-tyrosine phosphatase